MRHRYRLRCTTGTAIAMAIALCVFATSCNNAEDSTLAPESDGAFFKRLPGGPPPPPAGTPYGGPGDTVGGGAGGSGQPPGGCVSPPACGTFAGAFVPDWTMAVSNYLTGVLGVVGSVSGYVAVEYYFTVNDYNALKAQKPNPDGQGNYSIVSGTQQNSQRIWVLDYANNGAKAVAFDGAHGYTEVLCIGNFTFLSHAYGNPPNQCYYGGGGVTFNKACMDNLIAAVNPPGSAVLYVVTILLCSQDI